MDYVLDDDPLSGSFLSTRHLRPFRHARLVPDDDYGSFNACVERMTQTWGGVSDLLIPFAADGTVEAVYEGLLRGSEIDSLLWPRNRALPQGARAAVEQLAARVNIPLEQRGHEIPVAVMAAMRPREKLTPVVSVVLPADDVWRTAYITALGVLPQKPDSELLHLFGARADLDFNEVLDTAWEPVDAGSVEDLAARLSSGGHPVGLSRMGLDSQAPASQLRGLDGWLPEADAWVRQLGGDVCVVYRAGNVKDACLLWNLRLQHGWPRGLPLGIPCAQDDQGTIDLSATADRIRAVADRFGTQSMVIASGPPVLTSASISGSDLARIASAARQPAAQDVEVIGLDEVLAPTRPAARTAAHVVVLDQGKGHFSTIDDKDREFLAWSQHRELQLQACLTLADRPVVQSPSLRGAHRGYLHYDGGGYAVVTSTSRDMHAVQWPQRWTMLEARAHDLGLTVTASANGRHAMALTRTVASPSALRWLCHPGLLDLLYKKAASTSMSWFKERATQLAGQVAAAQSDPQAAAQRFAEILAGINVSHDAETSGTLTFGDLTQVLRPKSAAEAWLNWAERSALVRRMVPFTCEACRYKHLQEMQQARFHLPCPRCGKTIRRPFNSSAVTFEYRLAEPLRRAIDDDSIYHALVMRWLVGVLEGSRNQLVGAHPGVEFRRDGVLIGEADVLILLADGTMIPVEVKRHGRSLNLGEVGKLNKIAEALQSPAIILGAGDDRSNCPQEVLALDTDEGTCRIITQEYWLNPYPRATLSWPDLPHAGARPQPDSTVRGEQFARDIVAAERIGFGDLDPARRLW